MRTASTIRCGFVPSCEPSIEKACRTEITRPAASAICDWIFSQNFSPILPIMIVTTLSVPIAAAALPSRRCMMTVEVVWRASLSPATGGAGSPRPAAIA